MDLALHPESERIRKRLERCFPLVAPWSGTVFGITTIEFATRQDLLSGFGSWLHGGRWTPIQGFEAVYASLEVDTMMAEVLGWNYRAGFLPHDMRPRVLVAIDVHLGRVLNLSDGTVRKRLLVSRRRMETERWQESQTRGEEALTQAIGRLAWEAGWEGLLVPSSARKGGKNLVVFVGNISKGSQVKIVQPEGLPARPPFLLY